MLRVHGRSSQPAVPQCGQIPSWRWPRSDCWRSDQPEIAVCYEVREIFINRSGRLIRIYFAEISPDTTSHMRFWRMKSPTSTQTLSIKLEESLWFAEMRLETISVENKNTYDSSSYSIVQQWTYSQWCVQRTVQVAPHSVSDQQLSSCPQLTSNLSVTWDLHNTDLTWPFLPNCVKYL